MTNQPFHFSNGQAANNAQDLLELCKQYPDDATGYLVRQDLEKWLAYIGSNDVAECAVAARQIDVEDRQKLEEFLNRCHSLNAEKPLPAGENESKVESKTIAETPPAKIEAVVPSLASKPTKSLAVETTVPQPAPTEKTSTPQSADNLASKTTKSANSAQSQSKPSFFQVVAKFIINIFYRK